MALKASNTINTDLSTWESDELNSKISNTAPFLFPNTLNTVLEVLKASIQDINDSSFNKVDGISISSVAGLSTALAGKQNNDVTILKQANVVDNLLSNSGLVPLSANQGRVLKTQLDALPSVNSAVRLDEGNTNEVTASELRTHLDETNIHFTQASIDHNNIVNRGSNTHAQIDAHINDNTRHFQQSQIDHNNILNIGSKTHAEIDTHLASTTNPHSTNLNQVVTETTGLDFTKGNIFVTNGSNTVKLSVGSNGQVLKANSASVSGLEWTNDDGEVNLIESLGGQTSLYVGKSGSNLQIRTLQSTSGILSINNVGNITQFGINESTIDHANLQNVGTNSHANIDSHIASTTNPHNVTLAQLTPATSKGQLIVYNGTASVALSAPSNNLALVSDSTSSTGLAWSNEIQSSETHRTNTDNPHDTTLTDVVDKEGLSKTKGTLYVSNGTSIIPLAPGANGQTIIRNSATVTGLEWSTQDNVATHVADTGNPHATTLTQTATQEGLPIESGSLYVGTFNSSGSLRQIKQLAKPTNAGYTLVTKANTTDGTISLEWVDDKYLTDLIDGSSTAGVSLIGTISSIGGGLNRKQIRRLVSSDSTVTIGVDGNNDVNLQVNPANLSFTNNPEQTALSSTLTSLTQSGTFTPDYSIQALTNTGAWGFASQDEAETVLSVILNLQNRVNELETKLQAANILA